MHTIIVTAISNIKPYHGIEICAIQVGLAISARNPGMSDTPVRKPARYSTHSPAR